MPRSSPIVSLLASAQAFHFCHEQFHMVVRVQSAHLDFHQEW